VHVQLLLIAATTMALAYVLVATETGRPLLSWLVTAGVGLSATAFVYATEIYPEFPGALCLVLGLLLARRGRGGVGTALALLAVLTGLAWLGIKYAPLAAIVGGLFLLNATPRARVVFLATSAVAGVFYVWWHYAVFGHLTPYSINTVYEGASTVAVLESHVALQDRFYRLWGLFIDQRFGIGRWAPLLLLVLPALPLLAGRGRVGITVAALIATQILIATFVAITMMGFWFSGRTLVTVLPLFALALTVLVERLPAVQRGGVALLAVGTLLTTAALTRSVGAGEVTLAVDPFNMPAWLFRQTAVLFPNYTAWGLDTVVRTTAWLTVGGGCLLALAWREYGVLLRTRLWRHRRTVRAPLPPSAEQT
jgi:hypothetical protein